MAADLSDSGDECKSTMSASELRKANKPLMEKRRRARINESLNMLKSLVLDALKRDTSRYSKLEKADILEMTVRHLRNVQRQQMSAAMATDATVLDKYRSGYQECASEVSRYLASIDGLEPTVRSRLMNHMVDCVQKVNVAANQSHMTSVPNMTYGTFTATATAIPVHQLMQPVQVQIPQATQAMHIPGTPLEGSVNMGNPLLMVPSYHSYPSPNSSRSSTPETPSPGKDINHNNITGCYEQHDLTFKRNHDGSKKQRAFHPYRSSSPAPKDLSIPKRTMPLRPIVNQVVKTESMWRPW